jgi:GAF domain-containing protein
MPTEKQAHRGQGLVAQLAALALENHRLEAENALFRRSLAVLTKELDEQRETNHRLRKLADAD